MVSKLGRGIERSKGRGRTLECLERLEHLDEADGADELGVLGRGLDDDLKVLANVDAEHLVEALERLFRRELAKVVDEPLRGECVSRWSRGNRWTARTSAARRFVWTTTRLMSAMSS